MDTKAMYNISYGLFVLAANEGGRDNGCIVNTVTQVTAEPNRVAIAVNKANFTHDMIKRAGKFTASVISEAADFELFKRFGFQSGKDTDKFAGFPAVKRTENGALAVTEGTNAYICGEVRESLDAGSHTLFLADVTDVDFLSDKPSATYSFYQSHIKPKPSAPAGKKNVWRCRICGYEYEGEELPSGFVCPLCKHPASDFEKVN